MTGRRLGLLLTLAIVMLGVAGAVHRSRPLPPLTGPPASYARGSDGYYLAWIEHGSAGKQGGAARALLRRGLHTEYSLARRLMRRQSGVIRGMLLLALYDYAPAPHLAAVQSLERADYDDGFGWVKTDETFEDEYVDFYFDGPAEAAFRLAGRGKLDDRAVVIASEYAQSWYPEERRRAAALFRRIPELPPYDPAPQPKSINDMPELTRRQTQEIGAWFARNRLRLRWSETRQEYRLGS